MSLKDVRPDAGWVDKEVRSRHECRPWSSLSSNRCCGTPSSEADCHRPAGKGSGARPESVEPPLDPWSPTSTRRSRMPAGVAASPDVKWLFTVQVSKILQLLPDLPVPVQYIHANARCCVPRLMLRVAVRASPRSTWLAWFLFPPFPWL